MAGAEIVVGQYGTDGPPTRTMWMCLSLALSLYLSLILPQVLDFEAVTASLCPPFQGGLSVPLLIFAQ